MVFEFLVSVLVFSLVILMMAIGVMVGNRRIKGSCGGVGCEACSPVEAERCRKRSLGGEENVGREDGEPAGRLSSHTAENVVHQ